MKLGSNIILNISIDIYHVEYARVNAKEEIYNKNTRTWGLRGLTLTAYFYGENP